MRKPPRPTALVYWEFTPSSPAISEEAGSARPRNAAWYALGVALAIAVGVVGYPTFRDLQVARAAAPVSHASFLEVERHENDLRLTWKQNQSAVDDASGAVLSIRDGDSPSHELRLDREQLQKGSILYNPTHAYVQFQLAVTGADNTKSEDSVLAVTQGKAAPFSSIPLGEPVRVALIPPRGRTAGAPPRRFEPAAASDGEAEAAPAEARLHKPKPLPNPPPAYVAARAIHEARPDLAPDLRRLLTSEVEVRVRVEIDDSGNVVHAEVLREAAPFSRALEKVTRDAARLWKFTPATLGDRPVASDVVLVFCYTPKTDE